MADTRKASLFHRWRQNDSAPEGLEGISEEELSEFREAFRLFDKVIVGIKIAGRVEITKFIGPLSV